VWRRNSTSTKAEKPAKPPKAAKKVKPAKQAKQAKPAKPVGILVRKPKTSIFTVLLGIAAVAIAIGCLFLFLEISQYGALWSSPWNARG
jgi:hypothetical protein